MEFLSEYVVIAGRVQIRYYGIIIVLAMLVAAFVASRLARRDKQDPDHIWGALTWAIIPAIIGARLWAVLSPSEAAVAAGQTTQWYFENFFNLQNGAIAIWSGGLSVFGAIIGGFLGGYIYVRRNKLNTWQYLDYAGLALPLGQAIGRFANFVNHELYGTPTTLPWGISIDAANRVGPYRSLIDYPLDSTRFHPLFAYEALWNLGTFIVLVWLFGRKRKDLRYGDFFLLYLMSYSFIRFMLEFIRADVATVGGINSSQAITGLAFVGALVLFFYRRSRVPTVEEAPAARTLLTSGEKKALEEHKAAEKAKAKAAKPGAHPAKAKTGAHGGAAPTNAATMPEQPPMVPPPSMVEDPDPPNSPSA
ncbi:MAG TPA: prolipoprotein diacylglyceryl transferase [Candidatus Limnocylindrales bacterium]|nr:prolipoprotein diacylglyceryl transferase [Candidatus Limnocylindrales bacterium]